jgi:hypothetical protein
VREDPGDPLGRLPEPPPGERRPALAGVVRDDHREPLVLRPRPQRRLAEARVADHRHARPVDVGVLRERVEGPAEAPGPAADRAPVAGAELPGGARPDPRPHAAPPALGVVGLEVAVVDGGERVAAIEDPLDGPRGPVGPPRRLGRAVPRPRRARRPSTRSRGGSRGRGGPRGCRRSSGRGRRAPAGGRRSARRGAARRPARSPCPSRRTRTCRRVARPPRARGSDSTTTARIPPRAPGSFRTRAPRRAGAPRPADAPSSPERPHRAPVREAQRVGQHVRRHLRLVVVGVRPAAPPPPGRRQPRARSTAAATKARSHQVPPPAAAGPPPPARCPAPLPHPKKTIAAPGFSKAASTIARPARRTSPSCPASPSARATPGAPTRKAAGRAPSRRPRSPPAPSRARSSRAPRRCRPPRPRAPARPGAIASRTCRHRPSSLPNRATPSGETDRRSPQMPLWPRIIEAMRRPGCPRGRLGSSA